VPVHQGTPLGPFPLRPRFRDSHAIQPATCLVAPPAYFVMPFDASHRPDFIASAWATTRTTLRS